MLAGADASAVRPLRSTRRAARSDADRDLDHASNENSSCRHGRVRKDLCQNGEDGSSLKQSGQTTIDHWITKKKKPRDTGSSHSDTMGSAKSNRKANSSRTTDISESTEMLACEKLTGITTPTTSHLSLFVAPD